jgi:hypothetical protein
MLLQLYIIFVLEMLPYEKKYMEWCFKICSILQTCNQKKHSHRRQFEPIVA